MMRQNLRITFSLCFFALVIIMRGESSKSHFQTLQHFSRTRQLPGRIFEGAELKLSEQRVVSKLECLDICLRTATCSSIDMMRKPENWTCVIYKSNPNSQAGRVLKPTRQYNGWLHFKVSSQELQEVSFKVRQ